MIIKKRFGQPSIGSTSGVAASTVTSQSYLLVVGGNEIDGVPCIMSLSAATSGDFVLSAALPSADSATILPDGIGRGWLFKYSKPESGNDGMQSPDFGATGRVYILNYNYSAIAGFPLQVGAQVPTYTTETLTYTVGPTTTTYTAYVPQWR